MTLAEFLCARLDEEEALAVAAIRSGERPDPAFASLGDHGNVSTSGHNLIVRCDSKRRIVEAYLASVDAPAGQQVERRETLAWVVRQLALPYASHPDYRQEWHPEAESGGAFPTMHVQRWGRTVRHPSGSRLRHDRRRPGGMKAMTNLVTPASAHSHVTPLFSGPAGPGRTR